MSDHIQLLAANILAPCEGEIAVFTTSTTDIVTTLSASSHIGKLALKGDFLTFCAEGGDVYFKMTRTGADSGASGTISSGITDGQRGWLLKDGVPQAFRLKRDSTGILARMHHVCTAAAKKIRVYPSSGHTNDTLSKT